MIKKLTFLTILFTVTVATAQWKPAGNKIKTEWAGKVNPDNPHPEYPRPIMQREDWKNLNGLWEYSIKEKGNARPARFDGKILVPFPVESSLSGVMKRVGDSSEVWYRTQFDVPSKWDKKSILLHFGGVDWRTDIWLNDVKIGSHEGGYDPFSFDIAPFLEKSGLQELVVKAWDPTDRGPQPRGKQRDGQGRIFYTPVTGIWQTVWLEPVNQKHIASVRTTPDIDQNTVTFEIEGADSKYGDLVEVTIMDGKSKVASAKASVGEPIVMHIPKPKLWSPESPFLYDTQITLVSAGETQDEVKGYFAMRKISKKKDENNVWRMQLNNKDYFLLGTLDQGWWPDGLYTAPTDEALKYDIKKTKDMGFNLIRKHVKVEPARWYTHCDRMGILVWQDMPNGDSDFDVSWDRYDFYQGEELNRTAASEAIYRKEWKAIMDHLYSYPSIVAWVPFNERWGQFKTVDISEWTQQYDPSRLINAASGGNYFRTGDIIDSHHYPGPKLLMYDAKRINVLGEYGGIGLPLEGHLWDAKKNNWGYIQFKNSKEVTDEYVKYTKELKELIPVGYSAAIYTQTTDVEGEVNGLMTYDRKVDKVDVNRVRKANTDVIDALKE